MTLEEQGGGHVHVSPGRTVSRMIWKVLSCLERMHSIGTNEGQSIGGTTG